MARAHEAAMRSGVRLRRWVGVLGLVALVLQPLIGASPAFACTCGPTASPGPNPSAAPWDYAAVIVVGEVAELRVVPPFDPGDPDPNKYEVQAVFEVEEYIKGAGAETLVLRAHLGVDENGEIRENFSGCQLITPTAEGDRFVLFSASGAPTDDPGYCGASRGVSGVNDSYLDAIRAGVQGTRSPPLTPRPTGGSETASGAVTASAGALPRTGADPGDAGATWVLGAALAAAAGMTVLGAAILARKRG